MTFGHIDNAIHLRGTKESLEKVKEDLNNLMIHPEIQDAPKDGWAYNHMLHLNYLDVFELLSRK